MGVDWTIDCPFCNKMAYRSNHGGHDTITFCEHCGFKETIMFQGNDSFAATASPDFYKLPETILENGVLTEWIRIEKSGKVEIYKRTTAGKLALQKMGYDV